MLVPVRVRGRAGRSGGVGVQFDPLLADLAADGLVIGDRLLAHPDPFHRNRLGSHDGALGVQHDLVLLVAAGLPGHCGPDRADCGAARRIGLMADAGAR